MILKHNNKLCSESFFINFKINKLMKNDFLLLKWISTSTSLTQPLYSIHRLYRRFLTFKCFKLTNNGQVDFGVASLSQLKVNSAPVQVDRIFYTDSVNA